MGDLQWPSPLLTPDVDYLSLVTSPNLVEVTDQLKVPLKTFYVSFLSKCDVTVGAAIDFIYYFHYPLFCRLFLRFID